MIIFFHKSKTNQEGLDTNLPWHIHTNPMLPGCCPIRAMGVYLFTSPNIINKNSRLFPGEQQYWRYCYIMKNFIKDKKEDLANNGSVENLGSHSIWKGADFYFSCGSIAPPLIFPYACVQDGLFQVPTSATWNMKILVMNLWADLFVDSTHHLQIPANHMYVHTRGLSGCICNHYPCVLYVRT